MHPYLLFSGIFLALVGNHSAVAAEPDAKTQAALPSAKEAITRARLLHASFSGALSVMHRDFFRKDESRAIPSESLEDVFKSMNEEWGISMRWLATDETALNIDHLAKDDFQRQALLKIEGGEKDFLMVSPNLLRFAGAIVLRNECLKCHVKERQSLEDRFAALEITLALQPAATPP